MFFGRELSFVTHYGKYEPVYIISLSQFLNSGCAHALHDPLRDSLDAYITEWEIDNLPLHVFTDKKEFITFLEILNDISSIHFNSDRWKVYNLYYTTLKEQGIDIWMELRHASRLPSDDEAKAYLDDLNKRLRKHFEQFPLHHDNPIKLRGQKGPLRKSRNIPPRNVTWQ
ncbi:MAG: hypothetical protein WCW35_05325 [Bacteroidota bacterium]